ncbi:MAG: carbohydrate binding domain-containing protein, partial [Oscillospiraceae bacterium]|nr:carbohydrate binding domain-containing protein [Oscillospiraceae bacterium]
MNLKKITAGLTAVICCAGMLSVMPYSGVETYAAEAVYNNFETDFEGWHGTNYDVVMSAVNGAGYDGSRGMTVSGRQTVADGATSAKGFYLFGDVEYTYSMQVYSAQDEVFHLNLLCIDEESGEETVIELDSAAVKGGEWTELSAVYTAPADSYEFRLTLATDSTNDFAFDEVKITTEETKAVNAVYAASADQGLKDAFANYFRVGNILNGGTVRNSAITAMIIKNYNSLECENETKPDATIVQNGSTNTNIKVSLNNASAI